MDNTNSYTGENIEKYDRSTNSFMSEEFGEIRTVIINGEPWFVANDVAKALGYINPSDATKKHCKRAEMQWGSDSLGRPTEFKVIPEGDLYRLIAKSQLPKAEEFESWIFDEVLPSIRKTGGYVNNEDLFVNTYLPFADEHTKALFSQTLKVVREQNEVIQEQKREIMHKEDVIIGLVDDIDLATKRQRITQIVRHCINKNYSERYNLLYKEFERKYHCDLNYRLENDVLKPKAKNKMDYIDRKMQMIPQLYEIACKLFENDVDNLKSEWESIVM